MDAERDPGSSIRFGAFEADLRMGELRKLGLKVRLQEQPFQILALLLERRGQLVTREEIQRKLWPAGTFVDFDHGLNKAMNRLREALGDSSESPRFIETVPKRGYRFVAPIDGSRAKSGDAFQASLPAAGMEPKPSTGISTVSGQHARLWLSFWAAVLIAGATAAFFYLRRPGILTERDTVVLADFDNRTADPAFDYALKEALEIDLQESPFLRILSDQQVADTLQLMVRKPDQRLTQDIARAVCQRTGSKAVLGGSLTSLGSEYVLGLAATSCETGETLAQEQVRADRKEEVLNRLDTAASGLRRKLGESLRSIQKYDKPIHEALTTASLEAFKTYANGERVVQRQGNIAAIAFFRRATELDPNFAYAHGALGLVLGGLGESNLSIDYTKKAYALRERVSEWEKFFISVQYYLRVTGEIEKALQIGQVWSRSYPRERTAHNRLAYAYGQVGQHERALIELQLARQVGGDNSIDIRDLARTYMALGRLPEAKALLKDASERNPEQSFFRQGEYLLSFLEGDVTQMNEQVDWAMRTPGAESLLLLHSDTEAYFGRLGRARALSQRVIESALHNDFKERAALLQSLEALREVEFGNKAAARGEIRSALGAAPGPDSRVLAALVSARLGDVSEAQKLADQLNSEFPFATLIQNYWLPTVRAEIELHTNNPGRAIELLRAVESYELSAASPMIPVYLRAEAYLAAKQGRAATTEFQALLRHIGIVGSNPLGALAHLGLARAYAVSGDTANARAAYQDFFTLWKDADTDLPILMQARAEYTKLY